MALRCRCRPQSLRVSSPPAKIDGGAAKRRPALSMATERRKEQYRRAAEAQRRKKGIAPVKGLPHICAACGKTYVRNSIRSYRCPPCQESIRAEAARVSSRNKKGDPEAREKARRWQKERAKRPDVKVSAHISTLVHRALGKKKAGKSWRTLLDFTLEELMAHLERQFLPGMSWENQGTWHIDHIVPLSSFEITGPDCPNLRRAWALTNLRPLWANENLRKNAKRIFLL